MAGAPREVFGFDFGTTNVVLARITPEEDLQTNFLPLKREWSTRKIFLAIDGLIREQVKDLAIKTDPADSLSSGVVAYVEHAFFGKSNATYAGQVRTRTLIELVLDNFGIEHHMMATNSWKKEVCGSIKLKKEEAQMIAQTIWPSVADNYSKGKAGHVLDALCIAETGRRWECVGATMH